MSQFYSEMQGVASELLAEFKQGVIAYIEPPTTTGPAYNPVLTAGETHQLDATAKGVSFKYVDGSLIVATDLEVTAAVFAVAPDIAGTVSIDGKVKQIIRVDQIPAAGLPVAWRIFVRS